MLVVGPWTAEVYRVYGSGVIRDVSAAGPWTAIYRVYDCGMHGCGASRARPFG